MRFQDQVVVITGAAGGIGLAIAKRFASEGARLVLTDMNEDRLANAVDELKSFGSPDIVGSICDVSIESQVQKTIADTMSRFGRVDVIVNNAGLMTFKPIEEQTGEDWTRILNVDLIGAFFFTKHAFLNMNPGGCIINIASIHAIETTPLVAPYAAAKAGLLSLTRTASMEGKSKGIRVNAVLPGAIDTPMLWENPNLKSGVEKIDKQDVGKPEDIAATVAFLASSDAGFVTGASLLVDGGRLSRL